MAKDPGKRIMPAFIGTLENAGGGFAAGLIHTKITTPNPETGKAILDAKIATPLMLLGSVAVRALFDNEHVDEIMAGWAGYSGARVAASTIKVVTPDKVGLLGIEGIDLVDYPGHVGEVGDTSDMGATEKADWEAVMNRAMQGASDAVDGMDD